MHATRLRAPRRLFLAFAAVGLVFAAVFLPGCGVATPFRGPGWDAGRGVVLADAPETVVVALTYGEVAEGRSGDLQRFTQRIVATLPEQEGLVGWSLRRTVSGSEVWTMTVWRDGEAADDFLVSPTHREAMRASRDVFAATRFARIEWPTKSVPPTWEQALRVLDAGAPAKVDAPR